MVRLEFPINLSPTQREKNGNSSPMCKPVYNLSLKSYSALQNMCSTVGYSILLETKRKHC